MSEVTLASLARNFGWRIEDDEAVHRVEAVLRNGGRVGLWVDHRDQGDLPWGVTGRVELLDDPRRLKKEDFEAALVVSHRLVEDEVKGLSYPVAVIRPGNLALGLECACELFLEEVQAGISQGLRACRLAWDSVAKLATVEGGKGEGALVEFAERFRLPLELHSKERIQSVCDLPGAGGSIPGEERDLGRSEAAALLSAGGSSSRGFVIVPGRRSGRLTLAVAIIRPQRASEV
ncbi:MAG: cobalamin biosynthesis protein [Nitrospinota bacterium]